MKKILVPLFASILFVSATHGQEKAISYKELQKHLPAKLLGFTAIDEPDGQSMSMNEMSYSMASQQYEKGNIELYVTIMDYQGAAALYTTAAMAWTVSIEYEDDDKKVTGFDDGGFKGLLEVEKDNDQINLTTGYKERYMIQIELIGTKDASLAKSVLKELKLSDLP